MYYKTRQHSEKDMIFGTRSIIAALELGKEIDKIFIRRDMGSELSRELFAVVRSREIPLQRVPVEKLDRLTQKNHQGVVAFISPVTYQRIENIVPQIFEEGRIPFVVALDGVTDVRNFGAIARTCECAGVDAIVVQSRGSAALNGDAVKTSAGALLKIPVCREPSLYKALKFMKDSGLKLIAATEDAKKNYTDVDCSVPAVLLMGAEDEGIARENLAICDEQAAIPLFGTVESLNVSVAAGVLMYEIVRQRTSI